MYQKAHDGSVRRAACDEFVACHATSCIASCSALGCYWRFPHSICSKVYVMLGRTSVCRTSSASLSHRSTAATAVGGFVAERPAGARSIDSCAHRAAGAPALSSNCGQRHVESRRRRLNTDVFSVRKEQVRVYLPTYADNVALPAFARRCCSNRSISPAGRAHSSKPAAACRHRTIS